MRNAHTSQYVSYTSTWISLLCAEQLIRGCNKYYWQQPTTYRRALEWSYSKSCWILDGLKNCFFYQNWNLALGFGAYTHKEKEQEQEQEPDRRDSLILCHIGDFSVYLTCRIDIVDRFIPFSSLFSSNQLMLNIIPCSIFVCSVGVVSNSFW